MKRILIVDDYKRGAEIRAKVLTDLGQGNVSAEICFDGPSCIDRLSHEPTIDLVLLDIDMPDMSGADIIRTLLKQSPAPALRIIPMTAWGSYWIHQWGLSELSRTAAFKTLVGPTYDKAQDEMVALRAIVA